MYTQVDIQWIIYGGKNRKEFKSSDCDKVWFKDKLEDAHVDIVNKNKSILILG